jgi:1,4-dihydroxy-2-naphthoate octaprenyltransferase
MIHRSTIQLLRFHFSLFLLPVYLFSLSQLTKIDIKNAVLVFIILHLLVYPSSNGYNSYMDRDETPIGGLKSPMQPTRQLFVVTVIMDVIALVLSFLISPFFALGILLYILASRAYSYRRIRLKKYPIRGFLTVFLFQGAWIFFISYHAIDPQHTNPVPLLPCLISSMLIGALYPLTQIYQHEDDKKDGVTTISMILGKRGSFVFSMLNFLSATFLMYLRLHEQERVDQFYLFLLIMFPVVSFFVYWMWQVWNHDEAANFRNSLRMNLVSTLCTTAFFITLIVLNH